MRFLGTRVLVTLVALALLAPVLAPGAAAADITAWVETSAKAPGVGCVVEVSVEVRAGGSPVSGAEIELALGEDGTSNIVSLDRATTNGSGIAWLVVDTSDAWSGMKGWLQLTVNGSYLGGQTMRVTDGGCSGSGTLVEMNGSATTVLSGGSDDAGEAAAADDGKVIIPNVPNYQQQRGLSCEYSALSIATGALGDWVSEYEFEAQVPLNANPHWGYRGDITGRWGNTTNYGVYADPLVPALAAYGFTGNVFYGGSGDLMAAIDRGEPTLVWLGMHGSEGTFNEYASDGTRYQLTPYMHVMVAYGYDDGGVYLSDPGTGTFKYYDWGTFEWMWGVMDGMALSVSW